MQDLESEGNETLRALLGWEKAGFGKPRKTLEVGRNYEISFFEGRQKPALITDIEQLSLDEARVADAVLKAFRQSAESYDEVLVEELAREWCERNRLLLEPEQLASIERHIRREVEGFSVLDALLCLECLEEIAVLGENKPVRAYHRQHGWLETDLTFTSEAKITDVVNKISAGLGRRLTYQKPKLNANLAFGRIHAAAPPVAVSGTCVTIRRFRRKPFTPSELIANKTISAEALAFLGLVARCDVNALVCGNTGSGKTSLLNALFAFIPPDERVIIVEETPEISVPHPHQVRLTVNEELGVNLSELVTDTLRMRPDRIIVGEVRAPEEAKALVNTMLAGQGKGSFATFHAQSAREALIRLSSLGVNPADLSALDLIIVQRRWTRYSDGRRQDLRRVTEIAALDKTDGVVTPLTLFAYDFGKDSLVRKDWKDCELLQRVRQSYNLSEKQFEKELRRTARAISKRSA